MEYAIQIDAGHDANGNPKRAFLVYNDAGLFLGAIEEGYKGTMGSLGKKYPNAVLLARIPTTKSYYNEYKKEMEG